MAGSPDEGNPASVPHDSISKWANEGLIIPLGHIDDMPAILNEIDLVVLPTSYGEGVPRILVEAAACGLPLIATDVPGCREIVAPNVNGLLVPAKDSTSLAEAIKYLADNPSVRVRMGLAGRKKVLAEFDEKNVIKETLGVYRELMSIQNGVAV
jgi:glycosyltransferase involved in cell wall biosynthesis